MSIDFAWLEEKVLLTGLSDSEREALGCLEEAAYKKGDRIITQGGPGGTLYILRSGVADVEDSNRYEGRISLAELEEGTIFGELTFLNNQNTSADVTAKEDCVIYKMSQNDFADLMGKEQQLAYTIVTRILDRQTEVILSMKTRLAPMLRELSKKAGSLPLWAKLAPVVFIIIYILAFAGIDSGNFEGSK